MTSMLQAASSGDLARVQSLFADKVDPSKREEVLNALSAIAAERNHSSILTWCFDQGLSIPPDSLNNEVIKRTMRGEHIPIYETLAKHGVDFNRQFNEVHGDFLTSAADSGNVELVRWLLEHGHRPDSREGMDGESAIIKSVVGREPSMEVLKLLVEHGADVNKSGAFIAAAEEGNMDALEFLLGTGRVFIENKVLWYGITDKESMNAVGTALYRACYKGEVDAARWLIEKGADRHAQDKIGRSCREVALIRGHEDIVELLDGDRGENVP